MLWKMVAIALASATFGMPEPIQQKFGEVDNWAVETLSNGCTATRYFPDKKLAVSIGSIPAGELVFTFVTGDGRADRASVDRSDFGFVTTAPGYNNGVWHSFGGSEWASSGAGFIRIGAGSHISKDLARDLSRAVRFAVTKQGQQVFSVEAPQLARVFLMLTRCVAALRR